MVATSEALLTSVLILLSPVFLALPLSLGWRWWVGTEPEHEHYREKVRRVLDAGIPLRRYRVELDAEARRFLIDPERQSRIESDLLQPLRMQHECDHLDGILYPQRMNELSNLIFDSEMRHVFTVERSQEEADEQR